MHRRILLLGSSLALESIGAATAALPEVDLRHATVAPETWPDDFAPDAVLFDVSAGIPDCARACLAAYKDVLMLGFDLENHQVLLLSGALASLSTMADLTRILVPESAPLLRWSRPRSHRRKNAAAPGPAPDPASEESDGLSS